MTKKKAIIGMIVALMIGAVLGVAVSYGLLQNSTGTTADISAEVAALEAERDAKVETAEKELTELQDTISELRSAQDQVYQIEHQCAAELTSTNTNPSVAVSVTTAQNIVDVLKKCKINESALINQINNGEVTMEYKYAQSLYKTMKKLIDTYYTKRSEKETELWQLIEDYNEKIQALYDSEV